MQYWRSAVVISLVLILVIFSAGCGGGHSNRIGPITTITLSPSPSISLNQGDSLPMSVTATDAKGNTVLNQTFAFNSSNAAAAEIGTNGDLCAGQWLDNHNPPQRSLTNPIICQAVTLPANAVTMITVTAQGVTSNTVTVNVHPKVARVVVTPANPVCVSQGAGTTYGAQAFDVTGADVTPLVGNFTWTVGDTTVGTLAATTTPGTAPANSVFGVLPGATTLTATVNSTNPVNSLAAVFQECPVAKITITGPDTGNPNLAFSPSPGAVGATGQLAATVTDTSGNAVSNVPLTWSSSLPVAASVNGSGLSTAVAPGTASITASCALASSCNKNQNSLVTSNTVVARVSGTSATGINVYATSSLNGNTSLLPIDTGTNTAQTAIPLPSTPNSLVFDNTGAVGYLGSDGGLMVLNPSTNSLTKTVSNAPGQVLAVSPNGGQFVIVGGKLSSGSFAQTLLFNNSTNAVTALGITNAVAADFSPDGSEAIVADAGGIHTVQGIAVRTASTTTGVSSVSFLANGALAYLATTNAPSIVACNGSFHAGTASGTPTLVKTLPDGSKMLGAELPSLAVIGVALSAPPGGTCQPGITETSSVLSFGGGTPHAGRIFVTPDGAHAYITSDVAGKLLSYDVAGNATGSVTLAGTAPVTFTPGTLQDVSDNGGATLDSASVYVGVNDGGSGSVHQINVSAGTDATQISLSFVPNLVAVRPH